MAASCEILQGAAAFVRCLLSATMMASFGCRHNTAFPCFVMLSP